MRIMIVEDNARMRSLLRQMLASENTDICECPDGEEAVSKYRAFRPDVVVMDICMSGIDGIDATEIILQQDSSANVVIVTEHDDEYYREEARKAGAREYFLKRNLLDLRKYIREQVAPKWNGN